MVTPGAYADYVHGQDWPTLYQKVQKMLEDSSQDVIKVTKLLHKEKFSTEGP